jgi:hypothetical protein
VKTNYHFLSNWLADCFLKSLAPKKIVLNRTLCLMNCLFYMCSSIKIVYKFIEYSILFDVEDCGVLGMDVGFDVGAYGV